MLNQDISWFDQPDNSVSILIHKLAVEATNISYVSEIKNHKLGVVFEL